MLVLIGVGFVAGVVTALSPCVLPVLPIVLAGGAAGRRPVAIVAGIVGSFTVFTLGAAWLLDLLALPDDFLRDLAIGLLVIVAATLLWPALGERVSRLLAFLGRRPAGDLGGGVLLGAALGLVFVPCAGPVLAAITVLSARGEVGVGTVFLTLAYAAGVALPLLGVAFAGRRAGDALRLHAPAVRRVSGALVLAAALAIALGIDRELQTRVPGYVEAVQERFEASAAAQRQLQLLTGARPPLALTPSQSRSGDGVDAVVLPDYGPAPEFASVERWLNSGALTMAGLRGRVVLIDFWTYSCINCLRTLPFIRAWDERYRASGLTIVGVHTPEFAFERDEGNVRENTRRLSLEYPVALDNEFGTWTAWRNQYWPAKYLVDTRGRVRYYHFGEGEYGETEQAIRQLLAERAERLPPRSRVADHSSSGARTPETYLGYERLANFAGARIVPDVEHPYELPDELARDQLAYGGRWRVEDERIVAGADARLRLRFHAQAVHLVLSGLGSVRVFVDGREQQRRAVTGDRLYTLVRLPERGTHLLELRFTPGVAAYAFTFG